MQRATVIFILILVSVALTPTAKAEIDDIAALTGAQFKTLSADLVAALSHKSLTPAAPLGLIGFDLGLGVSAVQTESDLPWTITTGSDKSVLTVPRLSLHKGLPFDFDVGGFYASIPGTGIKFFGGEVKYAVIDGGLVRPAVAVRASATRLTGVDQLDLETRSLEVLVSKGLTIFTPYAGIGRVWGDVTPSGSALTSTLRLSRESPEMTRVFAGVSVGLLLGNLVLEIDKTGDNVGGSVKVGIRL